MLKIGEYTLRASYRSYEDFLEHVIIVADRFHISFNEATKRILKDEYGYFVQVMEMGGKTMQDVFNDSKKTFIYKNHVKYFKANGIDRNWLTEKIN